MSWNSSDALADDSEVASSEATTSKKRRRRPKMRGPKKIDLDALLLSADDRESAKPTHSEVEVIPTDEGEVFTEDWNEDDRNYETEPRTPAYSQGRDIFEMLEELEYKINVYIDVAFEDLVDEFCYELLYVLDEAFAPIEVQDFVYDLVDAIHEEIDFSFEATDWNAAIHDVITSFEPGFQKSFQQANRKLRNKSQYNSLRSLYDIISDAGITTRGNFNQAMKTLAMEIQNSQCFSQQQRIPDPLEKSLKRLRKKTLAAELKLVKQKWQLEAYESRIKRINEMTEQMIRRRGYDTLNDVDMDGLRFLVERVSTFDVSPIVKYRQNTQKILDTCHSNELVRVTCNEVLDIISNGISDASILNDVPVIEMPRVPKPGEKDRAQTFRNIQTKWRELQLGYQKTLDDAAEFLTEMRINEEVELLSTPRRNHHVRAHVPWT